MSNRTDKITAFVLAFALGPVAANAAPVEWKVVDGGNGHFYEAISAPGKNWNDANTLANASSHLGVVGHLVTITSAAENQFLVDTFALTSLPYWLGGHQAAAAPEPAGGWEWVTGEDWVYTNWAGGEPNNTGGTEDALAHAFFAAEGTWNDAPTLYNYGISAGYIVEYNSQTDAFVDEDNPEIFNQANVPGSPNPLSAVYQEILPGGGGFVTISCCRVLDYKREGAGNGKKYGDYQPDTLDLGLEVSDTTTNPTCVGMPPIAMGTAILRPWQRGTLRSRGLVDDVVTNTTGQYDSDGHIYREHDIGVCLIEADVLSKGVVYSEERTKNVLGYDVNCSEVPIEHRPFTAGVTTSIGEREVDFPNVTRWTGECDPSRSGKRYSDNVMVLNLRHYTKQNATKPYLSRMAAALKDSIENVKMEGCVDSNFLDDLKSRVNSAKHIIDSKKSDEDDIQEAIDILDDATLLALFAGPDKPATDPYGEGLAACLGNPKGLIVGRLMALKGATCSERLQDDDLETAKAPDNCPIREDILDELPELPAPPVP